MTFISYAQNLEDVMLWRALHHIENGFYIDAGAWSPDEDSVTRAFYERGWRGINIEPNPMWFKQLLEKRSKDINLQLALSDREEMLNLYVVTELTGLSTTEAKFVQKNQQAGQPVQVVPCQATTLRNLWDEHVGERDVHFLKIDVEGAERAVIRGNDWNKNRPWITLIEATYPNTQDPMHHLWEHYLLNSDYLHVYSDGLNRYYVAKEHSELSGAFAYPPNFFDDFKLSTYAQAEENVVLLNQQLHESQAQRHDFQVRLEYTEAQLQEAHREAQAQLRRADGWLQEAHAELQETHAKLQEVHAELQTAREALVGLQRSRLYKLLRRLGAWPWLDPLLNQIKH